MRPFLCRRKRGVQPKTERSTNSTFYLHRTSRNNEEHVAHEGMLGGLAPRNMVKFHTMREQLPVPPALRPAARPVLRRILTVVV